MAQILELKEYTAEHTLYQGVLVMWMTARELQGASLQVFCQNELSGLRETVRIIQDIIDRAPTLERLNSEMGKI